MIEQGKDLSMNETPEQIRERGLAAIRDTAPTRVDRWREENPSVVREWSTKSGGWVVQLPNYTRIYCHLCDGCGHLIVVVRDLRPHTRGPFTFMGSWPRFCDGCRRERRRRHDQAAMDRMRRVRARQREHLEREFARLGRGLPKPRGRHVTK